VWPDSAGSRLERFGLVFNLLPFSLADSGDCLVVGSLYGLADLAVTYRPAATDNGASDEVERFRRSLVEELAGVRGR
jgi:hypothetical protein